MNARIIVLFCFAGIFFARCSPLKNVTRPADWLPEVEVQVNSTAATPSPQQIDDYVTTSSYIPCTIRLMNASTTYFPAGYDVQIRNIAIPSTVPVHGGRLTFSSTGVGAGTATLNVTLPADGSWFTFYIRGTTNSIQDKDAVIEVIENRPADDEIIVARKSLQVTNSIPAVPSAKLNIIVNAPSTIDDYLTWSPMLCSINVTNPGPDVPADLNVTIENMPGTNRLRFAADGTLTGFTTTATASSINITVPASGAGVQFYVAGFFDPAAPSSNSRGSLVDKDAVLEVVQTGTGTLLGREGMMVRIRKDANNLTAEERDRFLNAIMMSHVSFSRYVDFFQMHRNNDPVGNSRFEMHSNAGTGFTNSAFLPWHRAYLQHLELLLQAIDPGVTIPYWRYDVAAPNVFSTAFMGNTPGGAGPTTPVTMSGTNPLLNWTGWTGGTPGAPAISALSAGIPRRPRYNQLTENVTTPGLGPTPGVPEGTIISATTSFGGLPVPFEFNFHGPAHFRTGSNGSWINNLDLALSDPLFWLVHSNMDRVWARWQFINNRFDPSNSLTYDVPGLFSAAPPGNTNRITEFGDETVWPWNGVTTPVAGATGGLGERPPIAPGGPFPIPYGYRFAFSSQPINNFFIDYRNLRYLATIPITTPFPSAGLNFAYDDVSF